VLCEEEHCSDPEESSDDELGGDEQERAAEEGQPGHSQSRGISLNQCLIIYHIIPYHYHFCLYVLGFDALLGDYIPSYAPGRGFS
jgi:hypothetical protein